LTYSRQDFSTASQLFERVQEGDSAEDVLKLLGGPTCNGSQWTWQGCLPDGPLVVLVLTMESGHVKSAQRSSVGCIVRE
jgi:hypothetical protein